MGQVVHGIQHKGFSLFSIHKGFISHLVEYAIQFGFDAKPSNVFHFRNDPFKGFFCLFLHITYHRTCQRMGGISFDFSNLHKKIFPVHMAAKNHIRHLRLSFGEGTRFVKGHCLDFRKILQMDASLKEDTAFGPIGNGCQGRWCHRGHQSTRRGHHQKNHGSIEGLLKGPLKEKTWQKHHKYH